MNSDEQFAPIAALDLDPIKVKLMHKESGEGWSLAYAEAVEFEYRRFLYLAKKFPQEQAAPHFDVDVFWHYHILDTMKYAADCEAVFGYFLHHFPYLGLRGDEDLEAHHRVGERMRELYAHTFGEEYFRQASGQGSFSIPASDGPSSVPPNKAAFSIGIPPAVDASDGSLPVRPNGAAFSIGVPPGVDSAGGSLSVRPNLAAFSIGVPPGVDAVEFDAHGRTAAARFYSDRPTISRTA